MFPFEAELSEILGIAVLGIGLDKYLHALVAGILWAVLSKRGASKRNAYAFAFLSLLFFAKEFRDEFWKGTFFSWLDVVAGYCGIASALAIRTVLEAGRANPK